jgi:hypothetical protein
MVRKGWGLSVAAFKPDPTPSYSIVANAREVDMRLAVILLASTLLMPIQLSAQTCPPPDSTEGLAAIEGRVRDAIAQVPLGFAEIIVLNISTGESTRIRSDPSGGFSLCDVPAGEVSVSSHLGQLAASVGPIRLDPGESYSLVLDMNEPGENPDVGALAGVVLDAGLRTPIEGAEVLLPQFGEATITNSMGRFTFPTLPAGAVDIEVSRLGYATRNGKVHVDFNRTVQLEILLSTEPVELDPIIVTAVRQRIVLPGLEGIESRINSGWGKFVLEEEIQDRKPSRLTDMLRETGVEVMNNGQSIYMRRTGCGPMVYIDGVKVTHLPRSKSFMTPSTAISMSPMVKRGARSRLTGYENAEAEAASAVNDIVHPMDVVAVEVYRGPAEVPGEYLDSNAQCGVILIWTRRGNIHRK